MLEKPTTSNSPHSRRKCSRSATLRCLTWPLRLTPPPKTLSESTTPTPSWSLAQANRRQRLQCRCATQTMLINWSSPPKITWTQQIRWRRASNRQWQRTCTRTLSSNCTLARAGRVSRNCQVLFRSMLKRLQTLSFKRDPSQSKRMSLLLLFHRNLVAIDNKDSKNYSRTTMQLPCQEKRSKKPSRSWMRCLRRHRDSKITNQQLLRLCRLS